MKSSVMLVLARKYTYKVTYTVTHTHVFDSLRRGFALLRQ